jgi:EmrB/QacA subfamily drug resistance transporter
MAQTVTYGSRAGRWVLLATILASGIAQLDATVVNVALPRIGRNLHIGLTSLQWTVNAYALTLSGLLLLGGSLGDRFGRRRIFVVGVVWFTAASLGCALAPSGGFLIAMRAVQGVGGAMLTPGSLAILQAVFEPADRAPAVGAWSGLTGVASAMGPVVGGLLVAVAPWGWRLVFLINLPLAGAVVFASRHIPETRDESVEGRIDVIGAALAAVGLAALIYGLTEGSTFGWGTRQLGAVVAGVVLLAIFAVVELRERTPMLPMRLFRSQQFSAANAVTIVVYGALGGVFFLLPVELQQGAGFSALAAGASLLPVTAMLLLLSARMGRYAARRGPRLQMTVGPIVAAVGVTLLARVHPGASYVSAVLPGILVFGLVMAAAPARDVGVASAVNNDVARTAALFAVAVLPALSGITATAYKSPVALSNGFHHAVFIAATLCALGGVLAGVLIRNDVLKAGTARGEAPDQAGVASTPGSADATSS